MLLQALAPPGIDGRAEDVGAVHLADDVDGRQAAALPRFCFWLAVGSGFCLAALALVISLAFRKI